MLRVSKVKYLNDYNLQIHFSDGKTKVVNLENVVKDGGYYFKPLTDIKKFKNVDIDEFNYTICWSNGAELSPDTLYEMGVKVKKTTRKVPLKREIKPSKFPISKRKMKTTH